MRFEPSGIAGLLASLAGAAIAIAVFWARSRKRRTHPRGVLHTTAPVPDPTPQNHGLLAPVNGTT
jgi:hypothetical protein